MAQQERRFIQTPEGYVFRQTPEGVWTDGDLTYPSDDLGYPLKDNGDRLPGDIFKLRRRGGMTAAGKNAPARHDRPTRRQSRRGKR